MEFLSEKHACNQENWNALRAEGQAPMSNINVTEVEEHEASIYSFGLVDPYKSTEGKIAYVGGDSLLFVVAILYYRGLSGNCRSRIGPYKKKWCMHMMLMEREE